MSLRRARRSAPGPMLVAMAMTLAGLIPGSAAALDFKEFTTRDETKVLLLYDCEDGSSADGTPRKCEPYQTRFSGETRTRNGTSYPGDAATLDRILSQHHEVSQVWLASGGGDLNEGLKLGRVLREHGQFTYVPPGVHCASSCTVAFLGGVLRDVDPKAEFLVHAPSVFLEPAPEMLRALAGPDGEFALSDLADGISERSRTGVGALLVYVQTMIGGTPSERAIATALAAAPGFAEAYRKSGKLRLDARELDRQGTIWAHDLLMRLEREASEHYLAVLKRAAERPDGSGPPVLGKRALEALHMIENMYRSRITGTFQLDQTTLREMGYTNVKH